MRVRILLALVVVAVASCAFLKSIGRTAAVAGGGAGGALLGSAAGPAGTLVGGGVGAGAVYAMQENSELRSGSLQGDGAQKAEINRLKSLLIIANGDLKLNATDIGRAMIGKEWAQKWFWRVLWWALGITALFIFVRRQYFRRAATGEAVESRFWTFIHAFWGSDWTREKAYGYQPLKIKPT